MLYSIRFQYYTNKIAANATFINKQPILHQNIKKGYINKDTAFSVYKLISYKPML
jgi:hypothetical protein